MRTATIKYVPRKSTMMDYDDYKDYWIIYDHRIIYDTSLKSKFVFHGFDTDGNFDTREHLASISNDMYPRYISIIQRHFPDFEFGQEEEVRINFIKDKGDVWN